LVDWHHRRLQQPVTKNEVSVYLSSPDVSKARSENRTASQSFVDFLHRQSPTTFPPHAQAVLCVGGDLSNLELRSGNFQGVDFSGSILAGDVSYVSFRNALLYGCTFKSLRSVVDSTVIFSGAQMGFSSLCDAIFEGTVSVTQANLTSVDLSNTTFGDVEHVGAIWHKAKLTNVSFHSIRDAQATQVAQVEEEELRR
jgi:uncharacterized protein YjbI with pentapeptide repeats